MVVGLWAYPRRLGDLKKEPCDTPAFNSTAEYYDVIKWKHFPRYWPFVRGIHRSPVEYSDKGQWRGALIFSKQRLSKQANRQWFETPSRSLWRHCNGRRVMLTKKCDNSDQKRLAEAYDGWELIWWVGNQLEINHDDVIKWKHFPRYWPFVRGIHRSPVISPHKGQWRGALMFTLICARINGWVNNGEAGDLRRNRPHHDAIVMNEGGLKMRVGIDENQTGDWFGLYWDWANNCLRLGWGLMTNTPLTTYLEFRVSKWKICISVPSHIHHAWNSI